MTATKGCLWGLAPDNPRRENWAIVRQAQANVAENDPWAVMVETDDISRQDDDLHYDNAGHLDFGERLANSYLKLLATTGDFDLDGILSVTDVDLLSNSVREMSNEVIFDVNSDGSVDFADFITLSLVFGQSSPPVAAAVPEPSALWLMGCGALLMMRSLRRDRRAGRSRSEEG